VARFVGAKLRPIQLREQNDFRIDLDEFRALLTPRTRLVILNSPHNPCGSILEREDVEAIAEAVLKTNAWVLSDEIYSRIQYEGTHYSILSVPGMQERTILMDGLSKAYAMTGWRLGFGVMPPELVEKMAKLMVNSSSCAAAFTQMATIAALTGPQNSVSEMVAEFRARRDLIVREINQTHGMSCRMPKGAFYAFANVTAIHEEAKQLSTRMLEEGGVACLPGTAFGEGGRGYLRFSYANSQEKIREGMHRMREVVARVELAV
jgi:aspartate/methionine/tyrosine aminotransferase